MRQTNWCLSLVVLVSFGTVGVADLAPSTAKSVRELLSVGFEPGRESLPKAKVVYDASVKAGDKSPEMAYAYGLVLLKQFKPKDAVTQFRLAADHPEAPYWPAWQALIFSHFTAKETNVGFDRLFDFAKRLQTAQPELALEEQKPLAQWMGQLVGALDKLAESPKARETVKKQDARVRDLLDAALQPSYDEGRREADDAALLVESELDDAKQQQQAKNEQDRVEKQGKIESDSEAAKKKAEAVKKSEEDWKRWLDDQLKQNDRLLARLEKDYGLLERRAQENLETQNQIDRQINTTRQQIQPAAQQKKTTRNNTRNNAQLTPDQRVDQLLNQKIQLQFDVDRLSQEAFVVSQNAGRVVQQRDVAMKKYQQMTGQLVKEEAATQKWQARLKKDGEKLKAPASDKGGAVNRTLTKAKSLRTYIDFDIADERQRLLDQIDPPKPKLDQVEKANDN